MANSQLLTWKESLKYNNDDIVYPKCPQMEGLSVVCYKHCNFLQTEGVLRMGTKAKLSTKVISIVLSALMAFSCVYVALPTLAPKAFAATAEEKACRNCTTRMSRRSTAVT